MQLPRDVDGAHIQRGHFCGIELNAHFTCHAAHAFDGAHARNREKALGDCIVDKPAQVLVINKAFAAVFRRCRGCDKRQHHAPCRRCLCDRRVAQGTWQVGPHTCNRITHIVYCIRQRFLKNELDSDADVPVQHTGVDVLDALQRGDGVFEFACHLGFELCGCCTLERGVYCDDGQLDIREILHCAGFVCQQTRQGQQHKQHDGRNRILDGKRREVHDGFFFSSYLAGACAATLLTRSPSLRKPAPLETSSASGLMPELTSTRSPSLRPVCTLTWLTWLSGPSTNT